MVIGNDGILLVLDGLPAANGFGVRVCVRWRQCVGVRISNPDSEVLAAKM